MNLRKTLKWLVAAQLLWVLAAFAQGTYKAETVGAPASTTLPKAVLDALQPQGTRVTDGKGATVCELWFRKTVPTQASSSGASDVAYPSLSVGTFVGVVQISNGWSDFRGQQVKPGIYTLRYALIPQDGNHVGVSTYRDFLLLTPVMADQDVEKALTFDALVKLSRQASGTGHPAVMSLIPATSGNSFPAMVQDDSGHWVLQVQVQGKSASGQKEFPMGLILVGKSDAA